MEIELKKLVFICTDITTKSGVSKVLSTIANNLVENYIVLIISIGRTNDTPFFSLSPKIKVKFLFDRRIDYHKDYFKYLIKLRKLDFSGDQSIVFCDAGWIPWASSIVKCRNSNCSIYLWEHTSFYNGGRFSISRLGRRIAIRSFQWIITLTEYDKNNYEQHGAHNVVCIYNPLLEINTSSFYNASSKKIVSCGSLEYHKGFDLLLDVATKVFSDNPDWTWDIFGEGSLHDELEERIQELHLSNNVFLKGYVSDFSSRLRDYSFFVMTSRHEGFGMVITEAQNSNLPVISFDCLYGPKELISDKNGILVSCYDTNKMAEEINKMISNEDIRMKLSSNSKLKFDQLTMKGVMNKWIKILD